MFEFLSSFSKIVNLFYNLKHSVTVKNNEIPIKCDLKELDWVNKTTLMEHKERLDLRTPDVVGEQEETQSDV